MVMLPRFVPCQSQSSTIGLLGEGAQVVMLEETEEGVSTKPASTAASWACFSRHLYLLPSAAEQRPLSSVA